MTLDDASKLRARTLEAIRGSASKSSLLDLPDPLGILFEWNSLKSDDSSEVRDFTSSVMSDDSAVSKLANACLGKSYSFGMGGLGGTPGDLVYRENDRAQIDGLERIMDVDLFRKRLDHISETSTLPEERMQPIVRLRSAWAKRLSGGHDAD
jgi:hypothetical protein